MEQQQYTYHLLVKGDEVAAGYGVTGIPTFYVIGPDGRVLLRKSGFEAGDGDRISKVVEAALRKAGR
jgi:hypothetical protein